MRNITLTIILAWSQTLIPILSQTTDMNISMKLSYEQFLSSELMENHKTRICCEQFKFYNVHII